MWEKIIRKFKQFGPTFGEPTVCYFKNVSFVKKDSSKIRLFVKEIG